MMKYMKRRKNRKRRRRVKWRGTERGEEILCQMERVVNLCITKIDKELFCIRERGAPYMERKQISHTKKSKGKERVRGTGKESGKEKHRSDI